MILDSDLSDGLRLTGLLSPKHIAGALDDFSDIAELEWIEGLEDSIPLKEGTNDGLLGKIALKDGLLAAGALVLREPCRSPFETLAWASCPSVDAKLPSEI
eukprot:CAMPEP_0169333198 /NCGR_PEP_ID=MMETSP1017-20121227/15128_1 /TAXON_ID=342587 /ORGANISM="Karlodinium micrum, Strain CCMP2283" /LENGTH=100 /DNA_ID=CAMNT_0009428397 /DNA_START=374 /DNA_END=676 /DNA_ORIENTATION=-